MSRTAHFGIGLGVLLFCMLWCFVCYLLFFGNAVARDSVPGASAYDSSFVTLYEIGGVVLVAGLCCAFVCFRRALRPPRVDVSPATPRSAKPSPQDVGTSEERLARLVKRTNTQTGPTSGLIEPMRGSAIRLVLYSVARGALSLMASPKRSVDTSAA